MLSVWFESMKYEMTWNRRVIGGGHIMTIKTHMELMTHDDNHIFVNPLYPATYKIHCTKHIVYCTLNLFLDLAFYMLIY